MLYRVLQPSKPFLTSAKRAFDERRSDAKKRTGESPVQYKLAINGEKSLLRRLLL